jgi:hypothetical protein
MGLFLFRFWPVLIPLLVYWLWLVIVGKRAVKAGKTPPRFVDGPWYWMVFSSLVIGIACFIWLGSDPESEKGVYEPPHLENGVIVPGQVRPVP